MKSVPIFCWDGNKDKQNKLIGNDDDSSAMYLTDLCFSETSLDGYYIQQHIDSGTKTRNIIFLVGGQEFLTPYSEESEKLLKGCLI